MPEQRQQIRSDAVQDILTKVPHWMILWGNTIILIILVLFLLLSWTIKYPDIIETQATVTSAVPPQKIHASIQAKLDTILVSENEAVAAGQNLAMLENSARLYDVIYLKKILDTIQFQTDHFEFPVAEVPLLNLGEINSSYAQFESDYISYKLNNVLQPYSNTLTANRGSVSEIKRRLLNLDNQKLLDAKGLSYAKNELDRHRALYDKGVISLQEFEAQEIKYLQRERSFKNLEISVSQLEQSLGDAYKTTEESRINNEIETTRLFKNSVQSMNKLKEAIRNWELKYMLRANVAGQVSFMGVWHTHQQVNAGDLIFTIIPEDKGSYMAKIKAPIQNSGKIKIDQQVNIKLLNYPDTEFGMLEGKVAAMSAIPNNDGFYLIDVKLNNKLISSYGIEIPFKAELNGSAEIITEDLRLLERFFYRLKGIFER